MAALMRAVSCQTGVTQWIAACSGLLQTSAVQGQCRRMLYGIFQRHKAGQFQLSKSCGGVIQANGAITQQNRSFYSANKHLSAKDSMQPSEEKVGAFTRIIEAMGFTGPLKYSRWKIKVAALRMYTCCVEKTDYEEFFNRCQMPDTLNSWFLVAQLHVWMCLVRMKQEGRTGKYMCRYIVHCMWEDVEQRGKVMGMKLQSWSEGILDAGVPWNGISADNWTIDMSLSDGLVATRTTAHKKGDSAGGMDIMDGRWYRYNLGIYELNNTDLNWFSDGLGMDSIIPNTFGHITWNMMDSQNPERHEKINSVVLKEDLRSMVENFYAALFGYDEGILSDDHVLAAALWRNLFNRNCEDPRHLELLVEYVRKQVQHLDALSGEDLLLTGEVSWRPLMESNARSILKPLSPVYNDEGL